MLGRDAEALVALDQALDLRDDAQTWRHKATALQRLGRHDEAHGRGGPGRLASAGGPGRQASAGGFKIMIIRQDL